MTRIKKRLLGLLAFMASLLLAYPAALLLIATITGGIIAIDPEDYWSTLERLIALLLAAILFSIAFFLARYGKNKFKLNSRDA